MVPAAGTSASSAVPLSQVLFSTITTYAPSAVSLGHGLSSATGTRASSAVPLCRGINSEMGILAPTAAPINHGAGACTLRAPPRHASRSNAAAVTARRHFGQTSSCPPLPDHAVAVGLRFGTVDPQKLFPDHEVAVVLTCEKSNTQTPRSFARLNPVFARNSSERSKLFSIKDESTRIPTSSTFSTMPNEKEPSRVECLVATCPRPAPEDAHRVYGPCFVF